MSFESIPADLLLKMFDQLPFKDRVRLRGVNQLFNEISWRSINTMRSLKIDDDLEAYVISSQSLTSLLESCSSNLKSIDATDSSCSKWLLKTVVNFVYPKLEHLKITVTNDELTKKLIGQSRNLHSIYFRLSNEFEWPEDVASEKLEKLIIQSSTESNGNPYVNLSPTLRPLIGKVPNLVYLEIGGDSKKVPFILSVQELTRLLAAVPCLRILHLDLYRRHNNPTSGLIDNMCRDFIAAIPAWHLPNLTDLSIILRYPIPASILQHFAASSPQLKKWIVYEVKEIDDQTLVALSKLKQLRELGLQDLEMTVDNFSKMIALLPSINGFSIKQIDHAAIPTLSQLQHLRNVCLYGMEMTKADIIDIITAVPTLSFLGIMEISDARSPEVFIDFMTSFAALFRRNFDIRLSAMRINGNESQLDQMKAVLGDVEKNGGPVVEMSGAYVNDIHYNHRLHSF